MKTFYKLSMLFIVLLGVALANADAPNAVDPRSLYTNTTYGFSLTPPDFGESKIDVIPATFLAPPKNGFSDNLNLVIQMRKTTRKEYTEITLNEFKTLGITLNSQKEMKVSGCDAVMMDYEGTLGKRKLHFLALFVVAPDRVYLLTCTSTPEDFAARKRTFQKSLESFRLNTK